MNDFSVNVVGPRSFATHKERQSTAAFFKAPLGVRFGQADTIAETIEQKIEKKRQRSIKARTADWFKAPQWLKEWRTLGEKITTGFFSLLPASFFRWIERKTIFVGNNLSDVKISLEDYKAVANKSANSTEKKIINSIQEVHLDPKGVNSLAWHVKAKPGKPTFLVSMGNTGSLKNLGTYYLPLMKEGCGVLMYEYPGYGSTHGIPSQDTCTHAARKAFDYLATEQKLTPKSDIVLYGCSLGGAVSLQLVDALAKESIQPKALILESTLTRTADVVQHAIKQWLPSWLFPLHKFVQSPFPSIDVIKNYTGKLLILHGTYDNLMDNSMGAELYAEAGTHETQKKFVPMVGYHNLDNNKTSEEILKFIKTL
ncbi:MAG: alpha/beta hydrolase [Vampirovibrionales bacterium]|nr:alpha/beta hydrolase [Vampirovibrionales bacterium]